MARMTYADAAHLLRRAGFGAPRAEVTKAASLGRRKAVDALLAFKTSSDRYAGPGDYASVGKWWLARMATGKAALQEKLTLFWHGHFATSAAKVEDVVLLSLQNGTLRSFAKGKFRDLLVAMSRDPAMIYWLDNFTNAKGSPNENYARELMELFSLGIHDRDGNDNYTQADVRDLARCFTGWNTADRKYVFYAEEHDTDPKSVLGLEIPARPEADGEQDALDVIARIAMSPQCAQFIVTKLWTFFAYPDPERALVDDLAAVYLANDTSIAPVLRAMFLRDEFYGERAKSERVSSPVEFAMGTLRTLRAVPQFYVLPSYVVDMGQELLAPPNVAGWPGGLAWITSTTRFHRMRFAFDVASSREFGSYFRNDPKGLVAGVRRKGGTAAYVDRVVETFGLRISAETRQALIAYVETQPDGSTRKFDPRKASLVDLKLRGLVGLVLTLPEAYLA